MSRAHRLIVVLVLNLGLVAGLVVVGVTAVGAVILVTGGWYWLDPAVALAIAVVIACHALALVRKAVTRLRPAAR